MGKITGTILQIWDAQSFGSKGFQKREFLIKTDDNQYPQTLKIALLGQDYVNLIQGYSEGQKVALEYRLNGSEWNGKYFTEISCYKIEPVGKRDEPKSQGGKNDLRDGKGESVGYDELPF